MTFPKVTPGLEKGKYYLYSYFHGSCTPDTHTHTHTRARTHTHTHTHRLIDWSQTDQKLSHAGAPSPLHDLIHNFQRSEFKQFQSQTSKCCLLTLVHSGVNVLQVTEPSLLSVLQNRAETSSCLFCCGCGRPLKSPCWFMFFTFDYY